MKKLCLFALALFAMGVSAVNAASISVSPKTVIDDPFNPAIKLDQYTVTLNGDGATILSIDAEFTGNLWQVQTGGLGGTQTTPMLANVAAFPANFQAADSHFLTAFVIPAAAPSEGAIVPGPGAGGATGATAFLRTAPVAFPAEVQSGTIIFANIVLPAGQSAQFSGIVGVSGSTDPAPISGVVGFIPEPASFGMASMAFLGLAAFRRRK
jgi:hypothetical protein